MKPGLLKTIMQKMCDMVGADISTVERGYKSHKDHDPEWYHKHSWTKEQEQEFIKWTADYLYENKKDWRELSRTPITSKKNARKVAEDINFQWGWKRK
jgi:hypothetical protein